MAFMKLQSDRVFLHAISSAAVSLSVLQSICNLLWTNANILTIKRLPRDSVVWHQGSKTGNPSI
jgi:hypothetical protein